MRSFLLRWLAIFLAVLVAGQVVPGSVVVGDLSGVALFAVVLAALNAVVRPLVGLVALPVTCLTLGLFTLVLNGLLFWIASGLVRGVQVANFGAAVFGALMVSLVGLLVALVDGG